MRAAVNCSGAPVQEILGRDWLDFIRGDSERERARLMLASALASGHSREREFDALDMTGDRAARLLALHGAPRGRRQPRGLAVLGRRRHRPRAARSTRARGAGPADARGAPRHHG